MAAKRPPPAEALRQAAALYRPFCLLFRDLRSQSIHLGFCSGISGRTDGDHILTDRDVLHAFQLGAHELGGHGCPGAILHQADRAVLEALGLEVGQQVLHRREEEAVVGSAGQHDLSAAEGFGDGIGHIGAGHEKRLKNLLPHLFFYKKIEKFR